MASALEDPLAVDERGVCVPPPNVYTRQGGRWDCGLACAQMALRHLGLWGPRHTDNTLRCLVTSPTCSVWTIDVCLMLHALGARGLALHTRLAGVDPAHAALDYYAPSLAPGPASEAQRITGAFAQAAALGLPVHAPSTLDPARIAARLQQRSHIYIALVDLGRMQCEACGEGHSGSELAGLAARPAGGAYWGHFVLLYGHDAATGRVSYLDPSALAAPQGCAMGSAALHAARCAPGTDEDIIEIEVGAAGAPL